VTRLGTGWEPSWTDPATAVEAITAAGLDYGVELTPLYTGEGTRVANRQAVVRDDSNEVMGVVGNSYVPIQNAECFEFLDAVVADGQLEYHTAGALGKGERVWLLAKLPGHIRIKNSDDVSEKFLLLSNAHDGTAALRVLFTPVRVVCANTLSIAHRRGEKQGISVLHKGDLGAKVREAQKVLGLATRFYDDVQIKANLLGNYFPTKKQIARYFLGLVPNPADANRTRARNIRKQLWHLFENGRGQDIPAVRYSAWAAFNAVTEFVDHHRPTRAKNERERASRRLQSQWFGSGARLKSQAWDAALALATAN
jgi:phage/plasmid-like protein (TIGR03299 family)